MWTQVWPAVEIRAYHLMPLMWVGFYDIPSLWQQINCWKVTRQETTGCTSGGLSPILHLISGVDLSSLACDGNIILSAYTSCCYFLFSAKSCPTLSWPHCLQPTMLLCPWDFPSKNTGAGCHSLLQGIFLTQQANLSLLHWHADSLWLSHPGGPCINPVVAYNFKAIVWFP